MNRLLALKHGSLCKGGSIPVKSYHIGKKRQINVNSHLAPQLQLQVPEGSKLIYRLEKSLFQTVKGKSARHHLARSRRSDSGERCEVKRSTKK